MPAKLGAHRCGRTLSLTIWLAIMPDVSTKLSTVDLSEQLTFSEPTATPEEKEAVPRREILWEKRQASAAAPKVKQQAATRASVSPTGAVRDSGYGYASTGAVPPRSGPPASDDSPVETPRGSMRATLKRLGVALPAADDEASLQDALRHALKNARMPLLRGLLWERGGKCTGCTERAEFESALTASLSQPLLGRHALPLFLFNQPLLPHTEMGLHLFEPRYKLLCRKALKTDRVFGFVSGAVGTLAKIKDFSFADDDATHGSCNLKVVGLRRFKIGRQWEEECTGCPEPLHYADASYFNDTQGSARHISNGAALVKQSLQLHHAMVSIETQKKLKEKLGSTPTVRDSGFAMSFWLAGACSALSDKCRLQTNDLLESLSVADRMRRVIKVQQMLVEQHVNPTSGSSGRTGGAKKPRK
jgi:Lon protease-like protein